MVWRASRVHPGCISVFGLGVCVCVCQGMVRGTCSCGCDASCCVQSVALAQHRRLTCRPRSRLSSPPAPCAVEDIDGTIAELEQRINHDSMSLNEEKRVMEQIKALKKSRA